MAGKGSKETLEDKEQQQLQKRRDLEGWSTCVEDLVDGGDAEGAVQLLEKVVGTLQIRSDAGTNLGLAAALNDLGQVYATQGLSLKSDDLFNSALLIKQRRAQDPVDVRGYSWEDKTDGLSQKGPQHARSLGSSGSTADARDLHEYDQFQRSRDSSGEPTTAGVREEEEWETVLAELPTPVKTFSQSSQKELRSNEKNASKQRGRGSFTYGGMGMYSDNLEAAAEDNGQGVGSNHSDHSVDGGASHVLILSFSPKIKLKDLEDLVKPFLNKGSCSVRWVDDTKALAVFSSPILARDALVGIKDARFKVSMFFETNEIPGSQSSIKDLAPPGPRPASSARVAQRMIASALSRQDVSKALLAKNQGSVQVIQKQERQRKERLLSRAQLRDEAWGSDDE